MAIIHRDIIDVHLEDGVVFRSFACRTICEGDYSGNRFGMRVFLDGELQTLNGCVCTGYFIRADGITLVLEGVIDDDSTAYIELPAAAYAKEGQFTLAIKVSKTGVASAMRIVDGTVVNSTTGEISDPGGAVPNLNTLLQAVEDAEAAAAIVEGLEISTEQIEGTRYRLVVVKES